MLCLAVMLSVMVVGAGAAFSDQDKIENTEAVDACSTLNIIKGYEDGAFHPERNIKRAEVSKMICVALNGGKDPNVSTNAKPTFTDVRGTIYEWAEGYIESCVAQGIVDGVGGTRFAPAGNVTAAQLAKMLLVGLGYNAKTENFVGNTWETNVNYRASQKGLYNGLEKMDTSAPVTRDQAAQMVWNAMQAYEVEYKDGVVQDKVVGQTDDKITLLRDRYNALISVGTLTKINKTDLGITMSAADELASDSPNVVSFSKLDKDYSSLLGQKVKVVYNRNHSDQVLGVFATGENDVYTVVANGTEKDDNKVKFDGKSYSVETNNKGEITTYVDGVLSNGTTLNELDNNTFNPNVYTFVDSNGNGKLDALIVKTYNVAKVTYAGSDKVIAAGKTYKTADENVAEGLKKDDWVVITRNLFQDKFDVVKADVQKDTLAALRNNKESNSFFDNGTISGSKVKYDQYQIGETWYNSAAAVQGDRTKADLNTVKAGDKVEYVAVNGIAFYMKKASGTDTGRVDNVALVMAMDTSTIEDRVKLAFFDGSTKTVTVDSDSDISFSALKKGDVYEYSVSGSEYSFEKLVDGTANDKYENYYGDLTYRGDKALTDSVKNGLIDDKFDGLKIDDNAQVLLYDAKSMKVADLTGKQFNALDLNNIDGNNGTVVTDSIVYGFSGDMNGLDRIGALAVQVNANLDKVSAKTWNHYGFITEDAWWITRNKTLAFKMWTGSEYITVQEDHSTLNDRQARTVIGYDTLTEISAPRDEATHVIDGVDALDTKNGAALTAITYVSDNKKTITTIGEGDLDISGATVLYVNSDAKTGTKDGSISVADKDKSGKYLANVLVAGISKDEPDLVVVEQTRWFKSDAHKDDLIQANNLIYGADENADNQGGDVADELKDIIRVSGVTKNANGDLIFNTTITAPEWAAANATYTLTYNVKGDGELVGTYTEASVSAGGDKIVNNTINVNAYESVEVEVTKLVASAVNVRFFDGATELTDKQVTVFNKVLGTGSGEQLDVKADWLAGHVNAKADYTITGATGTTLSGTVTALTNASGVASKQDIGGADTKALGTGYVDVKFTKVVSDGVKYGFTVNADANSKSLSEYGITTADKDSSLTFAWSKASASATGIVTLTATINEINAGSKYLVTVALPDGDKSVTVDTQAQATTIATFQPKQSIDLTKAMVTVKEIPSVQITKAEVMAQDSSAKTATIKLTFNQKLDTSVVLDTTKFTFAGTTTPTFDDAIYDVDGMSVVLTTKTGALANDTTLTVSDLKGASGQTVNSKAANKVTFKVADDGSIVVNEIKASA